MRGSFLDFSWIFTKGYNKVQHCNLFSISICKYPWNKSNLYIILFYCKYYFFFKLTWFVLYFLFICMIELMQWNYQTIFKSGYQRWGRFKTIAKISVLFKNCSEQRILCVNNTNLSHLWKPDWMLYIWISSNQMKLGDSHEMMQKCKVICIFEITWMTIFLK